MLAATSYQTEIAQWRQQREEGLQREGGWLTVAGLFWLHEGPNRFGKDPANEIVLPDGPAEAGVFALHEGKVKVTMGGETRELWPDSLDVAKVGRLSLFAIKRGDRYGIRLKDPESPYRRDFHGIESYPASEAYRVTAQFVAEPAKIPILNILGQTEPMESPGYVRFRLNGQELRLRPVLEEPDAKELFYIFRDQTSAKETYGAGRFLYSAMPKDGKVVLDFNKAYNPPCAFTPYATCPLPPAENRMAVKVEAGEKKYGH
ncbi:MAG TPA: DUF1684 domain-containing protein [Candidatus Solibacter sp.]|nr:DUF1684 domain-containing protein [Candidatus Solibacter sp.]